MASSPNFCDLFVLLDCPENLNTSLFLVGVRRGDDLNFGLFEGKTVEELTIIVPNIIQTIINAIEKDLYNLAIIYNHHLQQAIDELKKEYPNIILVYVDYYNAYLWQRFDKNSLQKTCCELVDYNYEASAIYGAPGVVVCADPNGRISWDGIHSTKASYKWLGLWGSEELSLEGFLQTSKEKIWYNIVAVSEIESNNSLHAWLQTVADPELYASGFRHILKSSATIDSMSDTELTSRVY
ncbi:PREDICTED: GDSL esterase/lipase At5g03980-like [Nicotiana attenuata]|uniref:GDSL esterase/lipase At5g03980-like n=1 Tax=Nicotiana attenuata TaxID=49451 RepID=UPI000904959C|nr:PREDICTED: GDSL esterase/lipase At5g03980-like [Nicotiana attenuata]